MALVNSFGQPVGPAMPQWKGCPLPSHQTVINGMFCTLEPMGCTARKDGGVCTHLEDLTDAFCRHTRAEDYTYLFSDPFTDDNDGRERLSKFVAESPSLKDPLRYAIVATNNSGNPTEVRGKAIGMCSYLRIDANNGVIEIGNLLFSDLMRRSRIATEAQFLMMRHAFEVLGYRRYEWKCDSLNAPSRNAALRLGFTFEGIFRKAIIYKGRSRDTAWFSVTDDEWASHVKKGFELWLSETNFDSSTGLQKERLEVLRGEIVNRSRGAARPTGCAESDLCL